MGDKMKEKLTAEQSNCFWAHYEDGWYTSCGRAFPFVIAPGWNNCPACKKFIVIDYYKKHVKQPAGGTNEAND